MGEDVRPRRHTQTEGGIEKAFWKLYALFPIERISIRMLTEEAGVHRSSFYHHYEDIYDLRRRVETKLVAALVADVCGEGEDAGKAEALESVAGFYQVNLDKMAILLGPQGDPKFLMLLREELTPLYLEQLAISAGDSEARYICDFLITDIIGFLTDWYRREKRAPSLRMMRTIRDALMNGCLPALLDRSATPARAESFLALSR